MTLGNSTSIPWPGHLDDAAPILADLGVDQLAAMRLQALVRPLFIRAHQARIACHIGGEDRGKTAGRGQGCGGSPSRSGLSLSTSYRRIRAWR
jgi:hypothetical protein